MTRSDPPGEGIDEGITLINLTEETLGFVCIPMRGRGDSVGSLYTQFGSPELVNITQAVDNGDGRLHWVRSRGESRIESSTPQCWVILVCQRILDNVVVILDVHRAEYKFAWQLAVLPGMLAAERPPLLRVAHAGPDSHWTRTIVQKLALTSGNIT